MRRSLPKAVTLEAGQSKQVDVKLQIQVEKQQVEVNAETMTVDTSPENNANAIIIKGKDLDALSDDPDELLSELQALAGPAAGPNGGEIYIDGFTGGQIPPKSSIREIRINQNPFSAEYDRLGYGRIEIFTKPGTEKLHGQISSRGNESVFNSQNPILNANLKPGEPRLQEPGYYSYNFNGSVGGPIDQEQLLLPKHLCPQQPEREHCGRGQPGEYRRNVSTKRSPILVPVSTSARASTSSLASQIRSPSATNSIAPCRPMLASARSPCPQQAYDTHSLENTLQVSDSLVLNKHLVDDIRFQYRRIRNQHLPLSSLPAVTVQGAFSNGGSNSGTVEDHQDDYELQNYFAGSLGKHSLNFGARLRAYRDANYTDAGSNSAYVFDTTANYLAGTPQQYTVTLINKYVARAILFDAALFYQDDWKLSPALYLQLWSALGVAEPDSATRTTGRHA